MRPGGKSNGESPFFETPNLSFEGRVRNVAALGRLGRGGCIRTGRRAAEPRAARVCPSICTLKTEKSEPTLPGRPAALGATLKAANPTAG